MIIICAIIRIINDLFKKKSLSHLARNYPFLYLHAPREMESMLYPSLSISMLFLEAMEQRLTRP